jgi:hypothetical protein
VPDDVLDFGGRAVARLQQDYLRWSAPSDAQAREILAFRQECEPMRFREFPNYSIGSAAQFGGTDMN